MTFGYFKEWLDILLHKIKPADVSDTSLGTGLKNLAIAGVILGILQGIFQMLSAKAGPVGIVVGD